MDPVIETPPPDYVPEQISETPQGKLPRVPKKVFIVTGVVALLLIFGIGALFLGRRQTPGKEAPAKSVSPTLTPTRKITNAQISPSPQKIQKTQKSRVAMVKDKKVVVKNINTDEEIETNIPIAWQDSESVWCTQFYWSADGTRLIAPNIQKMFDVETKAPVDVSLKTSNVSSFQWSSSLNGFYYSLSTPGTWFYDVSGKTSRKVLQDSLVRSQYDQPVSPDGKAAIIERKTQDKNKYGNEIYRYYVVDLITRHETEIAKPEDASPVFNLIVGFTWSPKSDKLAYVYDLNTNDDNEQVFETRRSIAIFDLTSKKAAKITSTFANVSFPVWSPVQDEIIFQNDDAPQELWKISADGSNPLRLSEGNVDYYMPANWSPDGEKIVFTKLGEGVIIINADGTDKKVLDPQATCALFAPK